MKKISIFILSLLVGTGLVLSACAAQATQAGLSGTSWKMASYGLTGNQTPAAAGIDTRLDFSKDGTVNGNLGCNSFSGNYKVTNDTIVFSKMVSTLMACDDPQMTQESFGLKIMNDSARFTVIDNKLTLYASGGDSAITFSK